MRRRFGLSLAGMLLLAAAGAGLFLSLRPQPTEAQPPEDVVEARPVRAMPVPGRPGVRLWVFVFPEHKPGHNPGGGKPTPKPSPTPSEDPKCADGDQTTAVPQFANANPDGLTFNINDGSIPIDKAAANGAISGSFSTWDAVDTSSTYFTVNPTGGASRPELDDNNTVGWVRIVPRNVLAAAWVWTDVRNTIIEADVFYNDFHKWAVFTECDAEGKYEVGNIGTHEFGHVVGLDHLSDPDGYATMYPTASKGEVRKRTLTQGDGAGYVAAGGK